MSLKITNKRFIIVGLTASLSLLIIYFIVLSIANSFSHAIEQFGQIWYWILLLIAGFGLQVGLYSYIRASFRLKQMAGPTTSIAASGGITTGSMVACCLHHLVDVLPLIGLAAAAVFLAKYQLFFIIIGVFSNLIGIAIMLEIIQKHSLSEGLLRKIMIYDMNKIKKATIGLSLALSFIAFVFIGGFWRKEIKETSQLNLQTGLNQKQGFQSKLSEIINLPSRTDNQNNVSFKVTPIDFNFDNPIKFEIKIDTHSVSLDFDLVEISTLEDDAGNRYQPLTWEGSPSDGHHQSGIITFPKLDNKVKNIKVIIQNNSNILPRIFEWDFGRATSANKNEQN